MNHEYIDQHDIAGQYLRKELSDADRDAFQAHLVDGPECADRVLLAEMFRANGEVAAKKPEVIPMPHFTMTHPKLPLRARIIAYLSPWQIATLLILAILVLLAVVGALFWWELQNVRPH
jgi:anti-sigma factor RsiW